MGPSQNKLLSKMIKARLVFEESQEKLNNGGYSLINHIRRRE